MVDVSGRKLDFEDEVERSNSFVILGLVKIKSLCPILNKAW